MSQGILVYTVTAHKRWCGDWKKTTVIDREQDRPTMWIKEAVHIRKECHRAMNLDEGSYQLSHAYDRLLDATGDRRIKTRKNWVPASSDEDLVMRSKRKNKVLKFWLWYVSFLLWRGDVVNTTHGRVWLFVMQVPITAGWSAGAPEIAYPSK